MCRTSPRRYSPVTSRRRAAARAGDEPAPRRGSRRAARADVVRRRTPRRRLDTAAGREVGRGDVVDVHEVAHLPAVLEDPRRLAALERRAEHRGHPGVRRVPRHPRAVDVVVAQRDHEPPPACAPRPRRSAPARPCWRRSGCAGRAGRPRRPAPSRAAPPQTGQWFSKSPASRSTGARGGGTCRPVLGAGVAALAVDHHRRRQHQPVDAGVVHRRRAAPRCRRSLWEAYDGQVGDADPGPDQRRLVADHVDAASRWLQAAASRTSSRCVPVGGSAPGRGPPGASGRRGRPRARRRRAARSIAEPMKPAEPVSSTFTGARRSASMPSCAQAVGAGAFGSGSSADGARAAAS